jgi:hypothetical protein
VGAFAASLSDTAWSGKGRGKLRQMSVRSDPGRLRELALFLEGLGCEVSPIDEVTLEVVAPEALRDDAAELEVDLYLRVWEARTGTMASRVSV